MSLFYSQRERRLWTCTLVVVAAIYSTLGLVAPLAGILNNQALAAAVFFTCMVMVGTTVLTQGLKTRPGGIEISVGLGIVAVYLLLFLRMTVPERSHLMEYSVVAVFIHEALTERVSHNPRVPAPALLAILLSSLVGILDECIQIFLPSRVFDMEDITFNILAAAMAIGASVVLGLVRRWFR